MNSGVKEIDRLAHKHNMCDSRYSKKWGNRQGKRATYVKYTSSSQCTNVIILCGDSHWATWIVSRKGGGETNRGERDVLSFHCYWSLHSYISHFFTYYQLLITYLINNFWVHHFSVLGLSFSHYWSELPLLPFHLTLCGGSFWAICVVS